MTVPDASASDMSASEQSRALAGLAAFEAIAPEAVAVAQTLLSSGLPAFALAFQLAYPEASLRTVADATGAGMSLILRIRKLIDFPNAKFLALCADFEISAAAQALALEWMADHPKSGRTALALAWALTYPDASTREIENVVCVSRTTSQRAHRIAIQLGEDFSLPTSRPTTIPPVFPDWDWRMHAACAGWPIDLFYGDDSDVVMTSQALSLCERCPVRADCLNDAIAHDDPYGIWGGLTPQQRRHRYRRKKYAA